MTHSTNPTSFVMKRPDGTPMSRKEVIIERRGAFKWLPVLCSNDLVHGSWWFVWGSLLAAFTAVVPLIQQYLTFYHQHDDALPRIDFELTWALLIVSGIFYTLGSYAFVRAFEEPPQQPLFYYFKHLQTDELLGAWLFLLGTAPAIPYSLVYFSINPSFTYFAMLIAAIVFTLGCVLFVLACYPNERKSENYLLPSCLYLCGAQMWIVKHLANDWLAGTWFFLWASGAATLGCFYILVLALAAGAGQEQLFVWITAFTDSLIFLIGSFYFVAGSYPHASQFYYTTTDRTISKAKIQKRSIKPIEKLDIAIPLRLADSSNSIEFNSSSSGPLLAPTKSQTMDLRLITTTSPMHDLSTIITKKNTNNNHTNTINKSNSYKNLNEDNNIKISNLPIHNIEDDVNQDDDDIEIA